MRKRVGEEVRVDLVGLGEANKGTNDFQNQGPSPPKPFGIHVSVMAVYLCSTQPHPPLLKVLAFTAPT